MAQELCQVGSRIYRLVSLLTPSLFRRHINLTMKLQDFIGVKLWTLYVPLKRQAAWTPTVLITLATLFIGMHLLRAVLNDTPYEGFLIDRRWSLEIDRSYPEMFQYLLAGLATLMLLRHFIRHHILTYLGWSLAFLFILVDDSFSLHERFTTMFVEKTDWGPILGLEAQVYAASILWLAVGLVLLALLAVGYHKDTPSRNFSRQLALLLFALFICGGVLDALHLLAGSAGMGRAVTFTLGTLEDGGELVTMSLALLLAARHARFGRTPN